MSTSQVGPRAAAAAEQLGVLKGNAVFTAALSLVGAIGLGAFALASWRAPEPLVLTLVSFLAAIGVFFIFGLLAGHFRITARTTDGDLARAIADGLGEAVQVTRRDGRVLFANAALLAMYPNPVSGHRRIEQVFAGDPAAEEALFRLTRAAERGEARVEEFGLKPASTGEQRWIRLSLAPLQGPIAGETKGLLLWRVADITEQRLRDRRSRNEVDAVLKSYDGLPVGLLIAGPGGSIQHVNTTLLGWLGHGGPGAAPRGELKLTDVLAPQSIALITARAAQGASAEPFDLDFKALEGRRFPATVVGLAGAEGGLAAAVVHRGAVRAIERGPGDAAAQRLFQAAPIGIATVGKDGRIITANAALARLLLVGAVREKMPVAQLLARSGDEEGRTAVEALLSSALQGNVQSPPLEIAIGAKGEYTRRVYVNPLVAGAGSEGLILYVIDATEQKALEEKYAQSQKMEAVGKLAGGIAHDFNNVLTAIIGWSDLLLQTQRPGDPAFKNVMNIKSSANRAAGLVNQLLAFSRRQTLQPEVLQLGEVLTDLSVLLNRLLGEKVELKIHQGRDLWYVKADRTQFGQVMINFAVNARDAMREGGRLIVRTRNIGERESRKLEDQGVAVGEYVLVEVEDTGTGMSPEILAKIFEPFFTTKGVGKGTGLGLSTVYGIVRQTGGYVLPESAPGKGTTFRVYLPRHAVENEDEIAVVKPSKKAQAKDLTGNGRVLLVEDEDAVRSFAVEALRRQGYDVLQASTGAEALEVMAENNGRVDLIVSDVIMPEMDGPTMLREIRKTHPDLKIIFMSGYPDDAFKNNLDPDTKFAFLHKPFSLAQLAAKVKDEITR